MNAERNQSTIDLLRRAREGDPQAREQVVLQNLGLVKYLVKKFLDRGKEFEDLYQYGCMGLLKAVDRFDPDFGAQFSTYAVPVILGEIRRYLRDDGLIHVARSIRENARKIEQYREKKLLENGIHPSVEEIHRELGLKREEIVLALNAAQPVFSLDAPVIEGEDAPPLSETIGRNCMEGVEKRILVGDLLKDLSQEDRRLILLRYYHRKTQSEIAREMGISQVQVSRLESRILKKMRARCES